MWSSVFQIYFPSYNPESPTMQIIFPLFIQNCMEKIPEQYQQQRLNIDFGNNFTAGGIDPRTGYTRKVLYRYTGYDNFNPIISLGEILNVITRKTFWRKRSKRKSGKFLL